jgi:hypothetical protein
MAAIVRNLQNDKLYEYLGEDTYRNIATGTIGKVDPDMAQRIFQINVAASKFISENPLIAEMITALNLKTTK